MNVNWTKSTLGDSLSLIRNGVNCKQDKSGIGDKISRIETIASAQVNLERVGFSILTKEQKEKYKLQQGDILFSHINSTVHVGKTAYIDDDYPLYHGINLLLIRAADNIDPGYLELFLRGLFWSGYWERICKKSVNQASVNQTDIKKTPFQYPPLEEQKQIVAKLDQCFEAIDKAKANATKNLENAKELFQSKLNEIFSQKGEGWVEKKLGDVCKYDKNKNQSNNLPYIGLEHIESNSGRFIGSLDSHQVKSSTFHFDSRHVLYGRLRPYLNKVLIPNFEGHCSTEIFPILVGNEIIREYLFYWLISDQTVKKIDATWTGARMPRANMNEVINFILPIPQVEEQKQIVKLLGNLREQTQSLESKYQQELNSLEELKKSILQKAFEGEL